MRQEEPKRTWRISQVQQLIGLPRRDIQRACYDGKGGVDIASPQDSSWGRRQYDTADLAKLFIVRQYKQRGYSLPQIARVFEDMQAQGGYLALLRRQEELLGERFEDALEEHMHAQALLSAMADDQDAMFRQLVEHALLYSYSYGAGTPCKEAGAQNPDNVLRRQKTGLAPATDGTPGTVDATETRSFQRLLERLAHCMHDGIAADDQATLAIASPQAQSLRMFLDVPGIDLVIELWLGAGAYDYFCKTAAAISPASACPPEPSRQTRPNRQTDRSLA